MAKRSFAKSWRARNRLAGFLLALWPLVLVCGLSPSVSAETNPAADDKEACIRNLKLIYDAMQAYKVDHKEIPNWLSDLVPQYISDASVLVCPACKRTGEIETSPLADPKLPCSYLYDFSLVPLGAKESPDDPAKTYRDLKRRQMGLVGSVVPIVRCRHHGVTLNLAFDGWIYESPAAWEDLLTNKVNVADLTPARIFSSASAATAAASSPSFPPRDPKAKPGLIDLSAYYNAALNEPWRGIPRDDLSSLPTGIQDLAGVEYDVRGIIQLAGKLHASKRFPPRVNGIKIQQKCSRLRFLHATSYGAVTNEGDVVGSYIVHFANNQGQVELPIIYGRDLRDWHKVGADNPAAGLTLAWTGNNEAKAPKRTAIRLFTMTWVNIAPDVTIESVDFVSAMSRAAPFLVAITAE